MNPEVNRTGRCQSEVMTNGGFMRCEGLVKTTPTDNAGSLAMICCECGENYGAVVRVTRATADRAARPARDARQEARMLES